MSLQKCSASTTLEKEEEEEGWLKPGAPPSPAGVPLQVPPVAAQAAQPRWLRRLPPQQPDPGSDGSPGKSPSKKKEILALPEEQEEERL